MAEQSKKGLNHEMFTTKMVMLKVEKKLKQQIHQKHKNKKFKVKEIF